MSRRDWKKYVGQIVGVTWGEGTRTAGKLVSAGPRTLWIHTADDEDVFINYDEIGAFSGL